MKHEFKIVWLDMTKYSGRWQLDRALFMEEWLKVEVEIGTVLL